MMCAQQSSSYDPNKIKVFVCDQHAYKISAKLRTYYQDQLFVDIALVAKADNFKILAHCNVLSASSDYLQNIICKSFTEAASDVIELEIDGATLKLIVDFMYSGTIELRCDNVERISLAADLLEISTLKAACSDFFGESIDITNWIMIASMGREQQCTEYHKKAFEFGLQHFEEVRRTDDFLTLTQDLLCEMISSDDLCVDSEETVFHSLVSWMEFDRANREKYLTDVLKHVRFSFLTTDFIKKNRSSVCKSLESYEMVLIWLESHLSPATLSQLHSERKLNRTKREKLGIVNGTHTNSLKLQTFDAELNSWSCEDLPRAPTNRQDYNVTVIDKILIIAGGVHRQCETNIVECLDLRTKKWNSLPPMLKARHTPAVTALNGNLYIIGGYSGTNWLRSVEKYDFRSGEWGDWIEVAPMHFPHSFVKVVVLGGFLYAVGIDDDFPIERYNPVNNKWIQISHKNENPTYFGIAGVGGHLYAVDRVHAEVAGATFERYNPSTDTWTVISPDFRLPFFELQCVSWYNRLIVCVGESDDQLKLHNSVEEYNPETNEWKTLPPFLSDKFEYTKIPITFCTK